MKETEMSTFPKSNTHYNQIQCISLPTRTKPKIQKIEEEINKLKDRASTPISTTISNALYALEDMYKCADNLLLSSLTQKHHSFDQYVQWANEFINASLPLLDVCGIIRDMAIQIKEHVVDLQSSLRRRKWDSGIVDSVAKYTTCRKKMKKDGEKLLSTLKQVDKKLIDVRQVLDVSSDSVLVMGVLSEVNEISICMFKSLLVLFCVPICKPQVNRWSLISKVGHKGDLNELEGLDCELWKLCRCGLDERGEMLKTAQNTLERMESWIEGVESGLECLFRRLIRARASLLNIISR